MAHITSNRWSRKKWVKEPAEINKKHCILVRGTCNTKLTNRWNLNFPQQRKQKREIDQLWRQNQEAACGEDRRISENREKREEVLKEGCRRRDGEWDLQGKIPKHEQNHQRVNQATPWRNQHQGQRRRWWCRRVCGGDRTFHCWCLWDTNQNPWHTWGEDQDLALPLFFNSIYFLSLPINNRCSILKSSTAHTTGFGCSTKFAVWIGSLSI